MRLYKTLLLEIFIINLILHIEVRALNVNQAQKRETPLTIHKQEHILQSFPQLCLTEKWVPVPETRCQKRIACLLGNAIKLYGQETNNTIISFRLGELVEAMEIHDSIRGTNVERFLEIFRLSLDDGAVQSCKFWRCNVEGLLHNATKYFNDRKN